VGRYAAELEILIKCNPVQLFVAVDAVISEPASGLEIPVYREKQGI